MTAFNDAYGVKVPIEAPIIIDGEGYGSFEGFALSHPDGPELLAVCLIAYDPATNRDVLGSALEKPNPFFKEPDPVKAAAAKALWAQAELGATKERLAAHWEDEHPGWTRPRPAVHEHSTYWGRP